MPQLSRREFIILPCGCLAAFMAGCSGGGVPYGQQIGTGIGLLKAVAERPSFTDADEERMAQTNAQKFEVGNPMWDDPLLEAYITNLGQRLAAVAKPRPFPYRFRVVKNSSVNAFTLPSPSAAAWSMSMRASRPAWKTGPSLPWCWGMRSHT